MAGNVLSCIGLGELLLFEQFLKIMESIMIDSLFAGVYGFMELPVGKSSFQYDAANQTTNALDITEDSSDQHRYFAMMIFMLMQFCVTMGVSSIPNIMLGEVFPFK